MTNIPTSFGAPLGVQSVPESFRLQLGRREIGIGRDSRVRYYSVKPIIHCRVGIEAGHLEILLFRRWLVSLSQSRRR